MTLHILNQSPSNTGVIKDMLQAVSENDSILLMEDATYFALEAHVAVFDSLPKSVELYALSPDIEARGLSSKTPSIITLVDDKGFVQLCCDNSKTVSWF